MSKTQCPQCFLRKCQVHPLQDSGAASAKLKSAAKDSTLDKMYDALVAPQIDRFKAAMASQDDAADAAYRASNAKEREKSAKRKRKDVSAEALALGTSGLNGNVVTLMNEGSSSDDDGGRSGKSKRRRKDDKKKLKKEAKKKAKKALKKEAKKEAKKARKKEKKAKKARKAPRESGEVGSDDDGASSDDDEAPPRDAAASSSDDDDEDRGPPVELPAILASDSSASSGS